jgi:dTDP-4-amino-4,6-dideoxygalactose transaminase
MSNFDIVSKFEDVVAEFYSAPYAVATDSCTHAIELCLRYKNIKQASCPSNTYLSVPMTFVKLDLDWNFRKETWQDYYYITEQIIDAAVLWRKDSYIKGTLMCISFQFRKHLSLGRGGAILCDDPEAAMVLKMMSYDGRVPNVPWAKQDVSMLGYHYYMTPETAELGLNKIVNAMKTPPKIWSNNDYPDLSKMKVFKDVK